MTRAPASTLCSSSFERRLRVLEHAFISLRGPEDNLLRLIFKRWTQIARWASVAVGLTKRRETAKRARLASWYNGSTIVDLHKKNSNHLLPVQFALRRLCCRCPRCDGGVVFWSCSSTCCLWLLAVLLSLRPRLLAVLLSLRATTARSTQKRCSCER